MVCIIDLTVCYCNSLKSLFWHSIKYYCYLLAVVEKFPYPKIKDGIIAVPCLKEGLVSMVTAGVVGSHLLPISSTPISSTPICRSQISKEKVPF